MLQLIPRLINTILSDGRHCTLILDDYHLIKRSEIHSAVGYLINNLPSNLAVIIGSRSNLPFSIGRLRAGGVLREVRVADLRFRKEECLQFLNEIMHLELSQSSVATLQNKTEGWAAALQLAALALTASSDRESLLQSEDFMASFSGGHRFLVDYLLEEVIDRLPEDVQWFLLATSLVDRFCPQLCAALLQQGNPSLPNGPNVQFAAQIIEQLIQSNLFVVTLDDQGQWYRYHHLFQEFLAAQLKKAMPGILPSLHRIACEWLAENQYLREAARHAFAVGDWEYAAAFVEKHSFTLLMHSDISTIYEWCSAFPEQVMAAHPALCIHQCWPLAMSFRQQYRGRIEFRLSQVDAALSKSKVIPNASELRETASMIRVFLTMISDPNSNPRAQLIDSQDRLKSYPNVDPGQFAFLWTSAYAYLALNDAAKARLTLNSALISAQTGHLFFGIVECAFHLALLDYTQGNLESALERCVRTRHDLVTLLPNLERELPAVGALDIARGVVLLERGCLDEAEISLQLGISLVSQGTSPYYLLVGYHALYRLMTYQNRELEAKAALEQLETGWPDIGFLTRGLRLLQFIHQQPLESQTLALSSEWLQGFQVDLFSGLPGMGPFGAAEAYYQSILIWIRIQVHLGNIEKTRAIHDNLLQSAMENNLSTRIIELSLLEAEIAGTAKDTQQSDIAIERALGVAGDGIFLQIFRQNPSITRLLSDFTSRHPTYPNIARILEGIAPTMDPSHKIGNQSFDQIQIDIQPSKVSSLPEPLTKSGSRNSRPH